MDKKKWKLKNKMKFIYAPLLIFIIMCSLTKETKYAAAPATNLPPNVVYEQIELVSLVMRLAGHYIFSDDFTEYQRSLEPAFREFTNHPMIEYTREITRTRGIGYDAPILLAIHLEKSDNQFQFIYGSRFWEIDNRWTPEIAKEFLLLLNDFYVDSGFGDFFEAHIPYFNEHSQRFYDELLGQINFGWFYQFGFNRDNMRITIRPSGTRGGFGPTLLDTVNYAVLPQTDCYGDFLSFAIHEFAHSFANPIAEEWYEENTEFRELSERSVDMRRMPWYGQSITMAREYVTRAYTILYLVENHGAPLLPLLLDEFHGGFPYIETVYAMITEHEPMISPIVRFFVRLTRNFGLAYAFIGSAVLTGSIVFLAQKVVLKYRNRNNRRA